MIRGVAYSLSLLSWDLFATYTFKNPLPKNSRRWAWIYAHLHRACDSIDLPYPEARIALRYELGEMNERPHFHALVGCLKVSNLISVVHLMEYDWLRATGAHAEIRPYLPGNDLPGYVDKCLGANLYEVGKFVRAGELVLSRSVLKAIRRNRELGVDDADDRTLFSSSRGGRPGGLVRDKRAGDDLAEAELVQIDSQTDCGGKHVSSYLGASVAWVETSGGVYQHLS